MGESMNRRQYLTMTGASVVTAVAGCAAPEISELCKDDFITHETGVEQYESNTMAYAVIEHDGALPEERISFHPEIRFMDGAVALSDWLTADAPTITEQTEKFRIHFWYEDVKFPEATDAEWRVEDNVRC